MAIPYIAVAIDARDTMQLGLKCSKLPMQRNDARLLYLTKPYIATIALEPSKGDKQEDKGYD